MRILFAISASLWAWIVARCLAFGPKSQAICWKPQLHADTWYRLTYIPAKIPHTIFTHLPVFIAFTSFAPLYIDNDIVHIWTVLLLVSEHTFVPIFVAHVHQENTITVWAINNLAMTGGLAYILKTQLALLSIIPKIILWSHITYTQLYIYKYGIQTTTEYQERQPRAITV